MLYEELGKKTAGFTLGRTKLHSRNWGKNQSGFTLGRTKLGITIRSPPEKDLFRP